MKKTDYTTLKEIFERTFGKDFVKQDNNCLELGFVSKPDSIILMFDEEGELVDMNW